MNIIVSRYNLNKKFVAIKLVGKISKNANNLAVVLLY